MGKCLCIKYLVLVVALVMVGEAVAAQAVGRHLPAVIIPGQKFLFYLHGGVVTVLGNNAINQSMPEWGPYEYLNILDSLKNRGFHVISEIRKEGVDDSAYVKKIVSQIDTLAQRSVSMKDVIIVGASAGGNIALHVSSRVGNDQLNIVLIGGCWPDTYKEYEKLKLAGRFLSIIEQSDPHGTCEAIFERRKSIAEFKEVKLNTGLSHGFLYKGYKEWIDPIAQWVQ